MGNFMYGEGIHVHTNFRGNRSTGSGEKDFAKGLYQYMGVATILVT